jgi:hypothetical protein
MSFKIGKNKWEAFSFAMKTNRIPSTKMYMKEVNK